MRYEEAVVSTVDIPTQSAWTLEKIEIPSRQAAEIGTSRRLPVTPTSVS